MEDIEKKINDVLENKYYQPFGGVSIAFGEAGTVIYAQAIVAKEISQ